MGTAKKVSRLYSMTPVIASINTKIRINQNATDNHATHLSSLLFLHIAIANGITHASKNIIIVIILILVKNKC